MSLTTSLFFICLVNINAVLLSFWKPNKPEDHRAKIAFCRINIALALAGIVFALIAVFERLQ